MANHKKTGSPRRPFGEIETRASGRIRARYVGPDKQKHSRMFDDETYAGGWLADEKKRIDRDDWTPPKQRAAVTHLTVNAYAKRELASRELAPNYRNECKRYLERFVTKDDLGQMAIRSVAAEDVKAWLAIVKASTGDVMAARVYGFVSSIFTAAVRDYVIPSSPFRITNASKAERQSPITSASASEVAAVVEHLPMEYRAMVLVAAWGGLRSGELRNLRRRDVDWRAGSVRVREQIQNIKGRGKVVRDLKTKAAHRTVFLPAHVVEELRDQLKKRSQWGRDGLVFPSSRGTPISQSQLWRVWDRARREIGRPDLRFHDLRHTAAQMAAKMHATVAELQARLGHATPNAAMLYQHAEADSDKRIAAKLSRAIAAGLLDDAEDEEEAQEGAR